MAASSASEIGADLLEVPQISLFSSQPFYENLWGKSRVAASPGWMQRSSKGLPDFRPNLRRVDPGLRSNPSLTFTLIPFRAQTSCCSVCARRAAPLLSPVQPCAQVSVPGCQRPCNGRSVFGEQTMRRVSGIGGDAGNPAPALSSGGALSSV